MQLSHNACVGVSTNPLIISRPVIGRVTSLDGNTAQVELLTHPGFEVPVVTADGSYALARTTDQGPALTNGSPAPTASAVYASQTIGEDAEVRLPFGVITAASTAATPPDGKQSWQAKQTMLTTVANPRDFSQIYVLVPHLTAALPG